MESRGIFKRLVLRFSLFFVIVAILLGPILLALGLLLAGTILTNFSTSSHATENQVYQPEASKEAESIPPDLIAVYKAAGEKYGVPWNVLAAIHKRETNFGRSNSSKKSMISSAGALGPMQFMPGTFKQYGVDGNGDGKVDIWNEHDAIMSAANMLADRIEKNKRHPERKDNPLWWAIWDYNHANWYVEDVLSIANSYAAPAQQPILSSSSGGRLLYPLQQKGKVTSSFGTRVHPIKGVRKPHTGTDIAAPSGTPVLAADGGIVVRAGWAGGYGKLVEIHHGNGLSTRYAHLSQISVRLGQKVEPGTVVGRVGSTGQSTGDHLHFEVRENGMARDPMAYLGR